MRAHTIAPFLTEWSHYLYSQGCAKAIAMFAVKMGVVRRQVLNIELDLNGSRTKVRWDRQSSETPVETDQSLP